MFFPAKLSRSLFSHVGQLWISTCMPTFEEPKCLFRLIFWKRVTATTWFAHASQPSFCFWSSLSLCLQCCEKGCKVLRLIFYLLAMVFQDPSAGKALSSADFKPCNERKRTYELLCSLPKCPHISPHLSSDPPGPSQKLQNPKSLALSPKPF